MAIEAMSLDSRKKEALASSKVGHIEREYNIVSDAVGEDGCRTIVLKPRDMTTLKKAKQELASEICRRLNETGTVFKKILMDTLKDYKEADILQMHKRLLLDEKPPPVKATPGCFKIILGDGRKKNSHHISIRE